MKIEGDGGKWNLARYFVEKPHIAWVALAATLIWGWVSFRALPQRKDPEVVIKTAVVTVAWPGASATDVEELVTEPIEHVARQVPRVDTVTSTTRAGSTMVFITLDDNAKRSDLDPAWSDLRARLDLVERTLPMGVEPVRLDTHFGDTAAVVYTIASPPTPAAEIAVRAHPIRGAIARLRAGAPGPRTAAVFVLSPDVTAETAANAAEHFVAIGDELGVLDDVRIDRAGGHVVIDFRATAPDGAARVLAAFEERVVAGEKLHPDAWGPVLVEDPAGLEAALAAAADDRYANRDLDVMSELLSDELARHDSVTRVDRHGVVPEKILVLYSQERLAATGVTPQRLAEALRARNANLPGGGVSTGRQGLLVDAGAAFADVDALAETIVATTPDGRTLRVRDVADVVRGHDTPIRDAAWLTWQDDAGAWHRTRAVSLAVQLRAGVQVTEVGADLERIVENARSRLPSDLEIIKTADQPELVDEKIDVFLRSLGEAVVIVIGIALLFMEKRSAVLVAASIPITLAMTFGLMDLLGLDLQQVSIAALIISLGLLVDDPVIASDAINREIAAGVPRRRAAWLGPVKLARAIFFATLTNVVAFAPLLLVNGTMGEFIYALPMVVSLALVSSRVVSMTFMPLLGYYVLRGQKGYEAALEGTGTSARMARGYNAITEWMLRHKGKSFLAFGIFLVAGLAPALGIRAQFFPEEALERFYVHVKLPEGADVRATESIVDEANDALVAAEGDRIARITAYVGSGGPRWWSNVGPEPANPAYALMIIQARDPEETKTLIADVQRTLTSKVPGARFETYRVSSGKPAVTPVEVRVSGPDPATLRLLAEEVKTILRGAPSTGDVTDDWGPDAIGLDLTLDDARAAAAGVTASDVARSTAVALSGLRATQLREGDRLIDVLVRLRAGERGAPSKLSDLYVWPERGTRAVPVEQIASSETSRSPAKIVRRDLERTITVGAIPRDGELASVLLADVKAPLAEVPLPPGYRFELGGEHEMQAKSFAAVKIALQVSVLLIFLALVWQFAHVVKPLIVFAAVPFGMVGVVLGLQVTHTHFGFMAFLGVASLIGVIVSHIIVLFDFIEEARERGVELHRAVIDAGLVRLRPVLVTVLATVGGLIPLGLEGGPMWQQLVYVQIGGLLLATVVTKGVVPLLYVVFVETFHLIRWETDEAESDTVPHGA